MAVREHTLSYLLRNSGAVLEEAQYQDVVLTRRDGEDLFLTPLARHRGVQESLGILARLVRAALQHPETRVAFGRWLFDELPWTTFLPEDEREQFLDAFVRTAAACVQTEDYEPLRRILGDWKGTAEIYANPAVKEILDKPHREPGVPLHRPPDPA
jgi:hypothetical protein